MSSKLEALIEFSPIRYVRDFKPIEVDPGRRVLRHGGGEESFDVLALVPPYKVHPLIREAGLAGEGGWPRVSFDKGFRHTSYDNIYVIGDSSVAQYGAPMAGFLAGFMAWRAARAIAQDLGEAVEGGDKKAYAKCFVDYIDDGAAVFCDFTGLFTGEGGPHCHVIAEGGLVGEYKRALERYWRAFKL